MMVLLKMHVSGKLFDKNFLACRETSSPPPQKKEIPSLNETSSSPHKKNPVGEGGVLDLLTVMILKRVNESIFFQINKFTASKVKVKKEVANSLMAFSLL